MKLKNLKQLNESLKEELNSSKIKGCQYPNCKGLGNKSGIGKSHRTLNNCPLFSELQKKKSNVASTLINNKSNLVLEKEIQSLHQQLIFEKNKNNFGEIILFQILNKFNKPYLYNKIDILQIR